MTAHVKGLLSAFLDGQLGESDRLMVETHVGRCEECSVYLKELKSLTQLLAATPARPLPAGFLQRLERRRGAEAASQVAPPRFFLPMPARMLAAGMSAAVVCVVAYDALMAPGGIENRLRQVAPTSASLDASTRVGAGARLHKGTPPRFAGTSSPHAMEPIAKEFAVSPKPARAAGAPIGVQDAPDQSKDITNEKLHSHLDAERKKLGILGIIAHGGGGSLGPAGSREDSAPMTPVEARRYMRDMTDQLTRQRMKLGNYQEAVPIGRGSKPQLLAAPQKVREGTPLMASDEGQIDKLDSASRNNRAAPGGAMEVSAGMANAPVASMRYQSLAEADYSDRKEEAIVKRKSVAAKSAPSPAPATPSASGPEVAAFSSGVRGGAASSPEAHCAKGTGELRDLWSRLGKSGDLPAVDFSSEMLVAVSGPARVEIVEVRTERARVVIEYREDSQTRGPSSAFRVVPKTDLPVELQRAR